MKIKNILFILTLGLIITACNKDDKDNFNATEQAVIDDEALVKYLQTHYLNEEDGGIWTIDANQTPLMDQVDVQNITENDIAYKLYYLVEKVGVGIAPTSSDSVLTTYTGMTLDSIVFDSRESIIWLPLTGVITGWSYGFTNFNAGTKIINPDESFNYTDYGQGILFIPSGLAYGNRGSSGISPNTPLVFQITLQDVNLADHDNDSILSSKENYDGDTNVKNDDTDKDGVPDVIDDCPEVPGLEQFNGCPDTDGDGIEDAKDTCPEVAGLAEYNGCPDTDGDGISDDKDKCPNVAGLAALAGCPDADGDGVTDGDDNCPNEAGPAANNGCPWPDADGDGVLDKDDQCPNEAGVVANNGCPEVVLPTPEVQAQLTSYARTINFNTGKSTFKEEAYPTLQAITAILKEYPKANFRIEGHTDSVGSDSLNQKLSDARANAVMDYLINNGVSAARLNAKGFGESSPIESNNTRAGRAANRRVEVKLVN